MTKWAFAATSVIARARQKDDFYIKQLDSKLKGFLCKFLGVRWVFRWVGTDTTPISTLLYYLLTFASGSKTLGEEYCQIISVDTTERDVPPLWKRLALALWQACFTRVRSPWVTQVLIPAHLAWFYWRGQYSEPIRRLLFLRHIYHPRRQPQSRHTDLVYWTLGALILAATLARVALLVRDHKRASKEANDTSESLEGEAIDSATRCSLCLNVRQHCTVTNCGHLFCWKCISSWLQHSRDEYCPLCRRPTSLAQLYCIIDPVVRKQAS